MEARFRLFNFDEDVSVVALLRYFRKYTIRTAHLTSFHHTLIALSPSALIKYLLNV